MPGAKPALARRCLAEGLATFALVFAGCGAIVVDAERGGSLGSVGIAATFGLVIMALIYAIGHLSGAHVNPAVTLSFLVTRHLPRLDAAGYVVAQLTGAVLGALVLRLAWDGTPAELGATIPSLGTGSALAYEVVLTALLMFVVMAVATDTRAVGASAAIANPGTVALGSLVGGRQRGLPQPGPVVRPRARCLELDGLLGLCRGAGSGCARGRVAVPGRARRDAGAD